MRLLQAIKPIASVMAALLVLTLNSLCFGQSSNSPFHSSPSNAPSRQSSETYAPVGPSGYKVLIPEIKMNRIIGDVKTKPPASVPPEAIAPQPTPEHETRMEPVPAPSLDSEPEPKPEVQPPAPLPEQTTEKHAPEQPVETPLQPVEAEPQEAVTHLPFDHGDRQSPAAIEKEDIEQNVRDGIERESHLFGPPLSPINITEALPEPTKEVFAKRQSLSIPKVKELEISKSEQAVTPVEVLQDHESLAPEDWVILQARKEADQLPFEEPKPEPAVKIAQSETPETKETQPQETSTTGVQNMAQHPEEGPTPAPKKEEQPVKETQDVGTVAPEGQVEVSAPPKEQIPSPLDEQAVKENDIRLYLSETAPVLEELSILMARAPSLNMADYDPSEVNTPVMPQDLGLKLESLKRDLRILDSKVFSIIPPVKYEQFHELIRQSISHTYLACEAIFNYFQDAKPEDLEKVKEHLTKARELIQLTRKRNSSG
ncbi:MAG: hypothetical protein ACYDHG_01265 [Desulfomonilaceae bacterium]